MKVALVHEYLTAFGGAEKVLFSLLEIFPNADIYTSIYNPKEIKLPKTHRVFVSFIQNLPFANTKRQLYLALMPKAFEGFDLSSYDLVISNSHSFAKGVIVKPTIFHFCYCHTPTRYLWLDTKKHITESKYNPIIKKFIPWTIKKIKPWDLAAAQKPDKMVANSKVVSGRIKRIYRRNSDVIYPPVDVNKFKISKKIKNYYLLVSRFEPYKRIDLAIKAFNENGRRLVIIGSGTEEKRLKKMAASNIKFLGQVSDDRKVKYIEEARGLIFPQEEDFGITAVEAQSAGRPVIAYKKGGATETIINGKTGTLFSSQSVRSLNQAIEKFEKIKFSPQEIKNHAKKFSQKHFKKQIKSCIISSYSAWRRIHKQWEKLKG